MKRLQTLLIPVLACGILLGANSFQATDSPLMAIRNSEKPSVAITPMVMEPRPMPQEFITVSPLQLLDRAIAKYGPDKMDWLEMSFRQSAAFEDICYSLKGQILTAPGQRIHFHLDLEMGQETTHFDYLCDGQKLVETVHFPGQPKKVKKIDLPKMQRPTDDPAAIALAREALFQGKTFKGVGTLLTQIRNRLEEPKLRAVHVQGAELLEIQGKWAVPKEKIDAVPSQFRFQVLPNRCKVYLDMQTFWPRHIEWWVTSTSQQEKLLVQTEYDTPRINQPLSIEEMRAKFTLP